MKKIGLFINGECVAKYSLLKVEDYLKAVEDCKIAIVGTGVFHELKIFED
jgi:hypothetical protein